VSTPVVRIRDLEFRYREGEFRLRVPELDVEKGASLAFVGPSGSGKTTLLHLIAGIVAPGSGRVETAGVDVTALSESERRRFRIRNVGLVFQELELLEYLSVLDNILLSYRIHPALVLTKDVEEEARRVAEAAGIGDKLNRYPGQLSQGERQRVAVCRAVLAKPALLLADEPTGNLDPKNKGRVLDILFEGAKTSGATLVTVTHDRDLLERFERVIDFQDFHG
jgi:putative ABC transport system ATP-binding protein